MPPTHQRHGFKASLTYHKAVEPLARPKLTLPKRLYLMKASPLF